jgi:hypothetical protein
VYARRSDPCVANWTAVMCALLEVHYMYRELFFRQILYPGRDQPPFVFRALSLLAPQL